MRSYSGYVIAGVAAAVLLACVSCGEKQDTAKMLLMLQEGKAQGHLALASDGQLGGEVTNGFWFGPRKSILTFDGDIDFGDHVRHVSEPVTTNGVQ